MKKITFEKLLDGTIEVDQDGDRYGILEFDQDQNAWILWPDGIDDGVSYWEDLKETQADITYELQHADDNQE